MTTSGIAVSVGAFDGDRAVGWCQLTPRADLPWLQQARGLGRPIVDGLEMLIGQAALEQPGHHLDPGKRVLHLVRDDGGHLADRRQPVAVPNSARYFLRIISATVPQNQCGQQ